MTQPARHSSRPPAQVYTRGATGAVTTHHSSISRPPTVAAAASSPQHQRQQQRRSRSQTRKKTSPRARSSSVRNRAERGTAGTHSHQRSQQQQQYHHHPHAQQPQQYRYLPQTISTDGISDNESVQSEPTRPHYNKYVDVERQQQQQQQHSSLQHRHNSKREDSPGRQKFDSGEKVLQAKTARRVMEDLSRAQGHDRRIAALTHVCESLDHNNEEKHNIELGQGALVVLARALATATQDDERRMICAALEMVFRANPRSIQMAYQKVVANNSYNNFLSDLLRHLERCETGVMKHADVSILNISKILLYLSRCSDLRTSLCRQPGMLEALKKVSMIRLLNPDCRSARIRILSNLANAEDNKILLYEHDGLVESIVRVAHLDPLELARQHAGITLMELASTPPNQVSMANNDQVLGTLVKMVLVEKSTVTREAVITALQNLAFAKENRYRLVSFKDGVLLEALKQALSSDLDAKARRRAAGALTNLVCSETAELMGSYKGLLDTLAIVSTKDEHLDVQTRASLALTKIANCITVRMECHNALLDALVVASLSKANNSVSAVLRVKARNPENRERMARHPGVIDTLCDICVSDRAKVNDRDNAMRAIMHLINETKNRKIMCNKTVLDALVTGANYKDPDLEEARDSAVRAMERLGTEPTNRAFMARHRGLLIAVAKAVEREASWEESGRESEDDYLAKPLLMSLLVAM